MDVMLEKYAKNSESTIGEIYTRIAHSLASVEKPELRESTEASFLWALDNGFVPAGRICSAAGTGIQATLINCFVQPVGDSMRTYENGKPGIYEALAESAETMRRGGGVGYDFSRIRPNGAFVKGTHSKASGPLSFMGVFDRSCETVESAGSRRGAQMGVLRCDHPDIEAFIHAKDGGEFTNFNLSIGVTDAFMKAVEDDAMFNLVHAVVPSKELCETPQQQEDGRWIYKSVKALDLWDQVMRSTYDHAEPGIIFLDRVNAENNLYYCEVIETMNPCGEQPLPDYGCCDLGSIDLTRFVKNPFTSHVGFDFDALEEVVKVAVRMLDNVLDLTYWPLPQQKDQAMAKRRIGLGFTGLGDALVMLNQRYDTQEARDTATKISELMRNQAYLTSIELSKEKGSFPMLDIDKYLNGGFTKRLPKEIRSAIRKHGIRNSHLLSIAPTGTISLSFCDNASNGIEPPFSWTYDRKKRLAEGGHRIYSVEDHAWRLYRHLGGDMENLPHGFITALEMSADSHMLMMTAVQPFVDTAISKTVNVPVDYPYDQFQSLYKDAWKAGLKGLATYRPNAILGSVLSVTPAAVTAPQETPVLKIDGANHRLSLENLPAPVLTTLRWPSRPQLPSGNAAWTYMVNHPFGSFAIFVGELPQEDGGSPKPFEVWVNGTDQPRGLGALAKTLSMDLRANDPAWLKLKLDALSTVAEEHSFEMPFPPYGENRLFPGVVAATAAVIRWRCEQLNALPRGDNKLPTPVIDAMFSRSEPQTGPSGTLAWSVDINNPATDEAFTVTLKEVNLPGPDGTTITRPCSIGFSGNYPRALDGLARLLSLDMRVIDPAWVGMKLRKLLNYAEPLGHFMAFVPGLSHDDRRQQTWPSTVAYLARLIIHRYAMLGVLNEEGFPLQQMGVLEAPVEKSPATMAGKTCPECFNPTVIHKDGCDFCTSCGYVGQCG